MVQISPIVIHQGSSKDSWIMTLNEDKVNGPILQE